MKFIPPLEIASKIMTLIVEAEKELILVSPYVKINNWDKMKKSLSKAVNKGINITFIVRKDTTDDLLPLKSINITPILVEGLHAKVYINDKYAIVTSQNITHYSDINSIDIGYQTETENERTELIDFVNKYIENLEKSDKLISEIEPKIIPAISTQLFERIKYHDYENKKQFQDFEVERLYKFFWINFPQSEVTKASSYIYCKNLLPFADVMIDSRFVIKLSKYRTDCEEILHKIESINFVNNHTFKIQLLTTHKSFYYLSFIPLGILNLDNLILDYFQIVNTILKSDIDKIMKIQRNNQFW